MSDPITDTEPVRILTTPFDITGLVSIDEEHQSEVQAVYLPIQQGGEELPPLYHVECLGHHEENINFHISYTNIKEWY